MRWLFLLLFVFFSIRLSYAQSEVTVRINNNIFKAQAALTPEARRQGLMMREKLGSDEAMLFIFDREAVYPFWMKNMKIPLDIIWMDKDKKVVYIKNDFLPCQSENCPSEKPSRSAKYVLEVNSGTVRAKNIKIGDKADFL